VIKIFFLTASKRTSEVDAYPLEGYSIQLSHKTPHYSAALARDVGEETMQRLCDNAALRQWNNNKMIITETSYSDSTPPLTTDARAPYLCTYR